MSQRISRAAAVLAAAFENASSIAALPANCQPSSLEDAYAIQRRVAEKLPWSVVGWKAGLTDEHLQRKYGSLGPIYGRIYSPFLLTSPAVVTSVPSSLTIEAEFAFSLGRNLRAKAAPLGADEICDAMDAMHLAIEVVGTRMNTPKGVHTMVADNSGGKSLVIGEAISAWRDWPLASQPVIVLVDDHIIAEGNGARVLGDPRIALQWLVNALLAAGERLTPGQVFTTGTCVGALSVRPDARIVAVFPKLGRVELQHRKLA